MRLNKANFVTFFTTLTASIMVLAAAPEPPCPTALGSEKNELVPLEDFSNLNSLNPEVKARLRRLFDLNPELKKIMKKHTQNVFKKVSFHFIAIVNASKEAFFQAAKGGEQSVTDYYTTLNEVQSAHEELVMQLLVKQFEVISYHSPHASPPRFIESHFPLMIDSLGYPNKPTRHIAARLLSILDEWIHRLSTTKETDLSKFFSRDENITSFKAFVLGELRNQHEVLVWHSSDFESSSD